jgi:acetyl-CoA C-acetyltransferase
MSEALIFDALRTARGRGKSRGALYEVKPIDLLVAALEQLRLRNQLPTEQVEDVFIGCVTPTDDQGFNLAKAALIHARWSDKVSGITVNRFCASSLEAVNLAAMKIRTGWGNLLVAGGLENMSRFPIGSDGGPLMYDPEVINRADYVPQGISADLLASLEGFIREELDEYAWHSHQKAAHAAREGYFNKSTISIYDRRGLLILGHDEYARPDTSIEDLQKLSPSFAELGAKGFDEMALHRFPFLEKIQHLHTAGNSAGIVDGAAVLLLGTTEMGKTLGLKPRARIVTAANVAEDHTLMLSAAAPAAQKALTQAKLKPKDIDLWECGEGFAAVPLKFQKELNIPTERFNVNGGAIALGYPLGAAGAILLGDLLDELERRDLRYGLAAMSMGGGMGAATIIERV